MKCIPIVRKKWREIGSSSYVSDHLPRFIPLYWISDVVFINRGRENWICKDKTREKIKYIDSYFTKSRVGKEVRHVRYRLPRVTKKLIEPGNTEYDKVTVKIEIATRHSFHSPQKKNEPQKRERAHPPWL